MNYFRNTVVTTVDLLISGGLVLLLLVIAAVAFALINNSRSQLKTIESTIGRLNTDLAKAKEVAAQEEEVEQQIANVRTQIREFERRLPTQREIPKLLDRFQEVASISGIQYQRIVAEEPQEQPLYVKLPFTINARGRYPQFGEFLKNLEFGRRFIKVESIHLEQEKESVSKATFGISTYTFVEEFAEEGLEAEAAL